MIAVSLRSVIAVSLNVGGGIRLSKPAKVHMCTQTHYRYDEYGHTAPGVRSHGTTAEPLGERRYENWITHKQLLQVYTCQVISKPCIFSQFI